MNVLPSEEPENFDRDGFTEENKHSLPNYTYLPFGEGPRMCLGKDRHLIGARKNVRFQAMRIKVLCPYIHTCIRK